MALKFLSVRLLFLLLPVIYVQPSNILLMPFAWPSHVAQLRTIGRELADRGHTVFIMLTASYPELEKVKAESGFEVIEHSVKDADYYTPREDQSYSTENPDLLEMAFGMDPLVEMRSNSDGFVQFCSNAIEDPDLPGRIRDLHIDIGLVDANPYTRCYWIILHRLGIPYVSITTSLEPWLLRVPTIPSFVPFTFAVDGHYTERMTFVERLWNLLSIVDWSAWPGLSIAEDEFVRRYLPSETYGTLSARSLLWLIDTDVVLDYPRPMMQKEVFIGGLSASATKPLTDAKLGEFVNKSTDGLIVVSFGSVDFLTDKYFKALLEAFVQIDQNIVWRYGGEIPASFVDSVPKNVLIQKWIPQNDLLGHKNTKLFVSHCGSNSQFEGVYHAVPMLCLALWGDQMYNAARLQYRGYGVDLGRMRDVTAAKLVAGVRDVIANRSYADNVRAASAVFRSRDVSPRQRAAWWVEHVIKHGGRHLHSYAHDMPWYEYLMLDVLCVCVIMPLMLMTSLITALLFCCCCRRRHQESSTGRRHLKSS